MAKQIVGLFEGTFDKITFFEIVDNYKEYTILRKSGTNKYYLYDNITKAFTEDDIKIINVPENKNLYEKLLHPMDYDWYLNALFFWADSRIVTDFGLPGYEKIKELYINLMDVKLKDHELDRQLHLAKQEGFLTWLTALFTIKRLSRPQKKLLKRIIKEYKIIW